MKIYKVYHEYSGGGIEMSAMVTVQDQYGTVWDHWQIDRDHFDGSRAFHDAVRKQITDAKAEWKVEL